jgi:hypothetical protein
MKWKRSRLGLLGMLALALTVTVGMTAGVADAKKKKGKKGGQVTVTGPATAIPPAVGGIGSLTDIPLRVGKKAKGMVVANGSVDFTGTFSGPAGFGDDIEVELVGPDGLAIDLDWPEDDETGLVGPLTWTPHSHFFLCPSLAVMPQPCNNPKHNIIRPYIGLVSSPLLALFYGTPAFGNWHLLVVNTGPTIAQLVLARLALELTRPPITAF